MSSCYRCKGTLKGEWDLRDCHKEESNASGRFVGVEGFFLTTLAASNKDSPGWISGYCESCWQPGLLSHSLVQKALKTQSDQYEEKLKQLENENKTLSNEISNLQNELTTTTEIFTKEREQLQMLCDERKTHLSNLLIELAREKKDSDLKDITISDLKIQLYRLKAETVSLELKNVDFEEQKSHVEVISETPPNLSIQMDSLLDLNQPHGWSIKSVNSEKLQKLSDNKMIIVAILGMYDVGKSWFCNEFCGKKLFTSGSGQRTDSLDCHFPTKDGNLIGIIDTPGSNEAIRCSRKDLIQKVEAAQVKDTNIETLKETSYSHHQKSMLHYKLLKNDAKILQDVKEKFMGEVADVLILICNKLSEKEQESIYKVIKYHKKILKERTRSQERSGGAFRRETILYIIHNYKMLSEKEQVEKQIKRDLQDTFRVEEVPMFTGDSRLRFESQDCNKMMYQDQFGISHLILAAKGTNAGKYYNPSTFGFLKQKIDVIEHRTSVDVKNLFLEFCNRNIPTILKQDNIRLQLNPDETAIVKVDDSPKVVFENMRYDEFGDFSVSSAFEPKYSVIERKKDSKTIEVLLAMELLDSEFTSILKQDLKRHWCLFVRGEKKIHEDATGMHNGQDRGQFDLKITVLKKGEFLTVKRDPPVKGTKDGIVRWTFDFNLDGEILV